MNDIKQKLKTILINDLKIQEAALEDLDDDDPLFGEGLGLDSLDAVELAVLIHKHFDIQIVDAEKGKKAFSSINSLVNFISNLKKDG